MAENNPNPQFYILLKKKVLSYVKNSSVASSQSLKFSNTMIEALKSIQALLSGNDYNSIMNSLGIMILESQNLQETFDISGRIQKDSQ